MDLNDLIVMKKVAEGLEGATTNLAQFTAVRQNMEKQEKADKINSQFNKLKLEKTKLQLEGLERKNKLAKVKYENYQSFIKGKIEGGQTGGQPNVQAGVQAGPTADQDGSGIRFQEEGALPSLEEYNESQTLKGQRNIAKENRATKDQQMQETKFVQGQEDRDYKISKREYEEAKATATTEKLNLEIEQLKNKPEQDQRKWASETSKLIYEYDFDENTTLNDKGVQTILQHPYLGQGFLDFIKYKAPTTKTVNPIFGSSREEVQDDGVFPDVSPTKVEAYLNRGLAKAKADTGNKALPQGVTLTEDVREKDGVNYIKGSDGKYYKQSIYGE